MKKQLLIILTAGFFMNLSSQNVYQSDLENWSGTPLNPTLDWMGVKTNINADSVQQNATLPYHGTYSAKLINSTTTAKRFTTKHVNITSGKAYLVSYSARGKGSIRAGLYTGSHGAAAGYYYSNYESVSSTGWHRFKQSIVADTTNNSTSEFIIAVKSTVAANGHLDLDSVTIEEYVPPTGVSLYNIQYTTNGVSPYYGQILQNIGGIATATYSSGYYLQTKGTNAWAGILVYDPTNAANVAMGDSIKLSGTVEEYFGMTEMINITGWSKVSSGNTVPTPVNLSTSAVNDEMYEGVLVTAACATCLTYSVSFGQAAISDGSDTTLVDDQIYPFTYVVGATYMLTGPVNYSFGYNIEPRGSADIVVSCTLGFSEYNNTFDAEVYPNPVAEELNIKLPFTAEKVNVKIIDVLGKEFISTTTSGNEMTLQNIDLPAGVYVVKITADGKTKMMKIVKE